MRFLELHLRRFGPFTDVRLPLAAGSEGLHVVYGPNEAGKSSALRALRAWLFGFGHLTGDDFVHDRSLLRVGGRLRGAGGEELLCYRRRGRKQTLLDASEQPVAEERLAALLGGVDADTFDTLFGIDHASLVSGGRALLEERGAEAGALFGAGLGGAGLHEVLAELDAEAGSLFLPKGSKPALNVAVADYERLEKETRAASLAPSHWNDARRARAAAAARLAAAEEELAVARQRVARLQRVRRSLPRLRRRDELLAELAALGELPALPEDIAQQRATADADLVAACQGIEREQRHLDDVRASRASLVFDEALFAERAALSGLGERLGSYEKAMQDRPGLVAKRDGLLSQARARLASARADLTVDDMPALRALTARRRRVSQLAAERQRVGADLRRAAGARARALQQREQAEAGLREQPAPPEPGALRGAVTAAQRAGDVDERLAEAERALSSHDGRVADRLRALGRWSGSAAALLSAALPESEAVRACQEGSAELDARERQLRESGDASRADAERQRTRLRALRAAGDVPGEAELAAARERRGQGWRSVQARWRAGDPSDAPDPHLAAGQPLSAVYEAAVSEADLVADRLRREAERVHQRATAESELEAAGRRLADLDRQLADLAREREQTNAAWQALWSASGVAAGAPREMLEWLGRADALRALLGQREALLAEVDRQRRRRARLVASLRAELAAPNAGSQVPEDAPLAVALSRAEPRLAALETALAARRNAAEELARLRREEQAALREHAQVVAAEAGWREAWADLAAAIGASADAGPDEAAEELEAVADAVAHADKALGFEERIVEIDAEAARFEAHGRALLARVAEDLATQPLPSALRALAGRLRDEEETRARAALLDGQVEAAVQRIREAEDKRRTAQAALDRLCAMARCQRDELPAVVERHERRVRLVRELAVEERELRAGGDGLAFEQLAAEAGGMSTDEAASELAALEERVEAVLQPRLRALQAESFQAERAFDAMRGEDTAASLAERAQQSLAEVRRLVERYLRTRLAAQLVRHEMERYRRLHRDPILERASGYFAALTDGAFEAVESSLDSADRAVLIGRRRGGEELLVEGMSAGTRDQLYLALRLATLDARARSAEPLPFVVDDILVQFDDARSAATLRALAAFSRRSQVVLFTHHGQVAAQAEALSADGEPVFVHALGG